MAWFRPTSHVANGWTSPASAYDGNIATSAAFAIGTGWSPYLEMYFTARNIDQVRLYTSRQNDQVSAMQFDVYYDGVWNNVYDGPTLAAGDYTTLDIGEHIATGVRYRANRPSGGGTRSAYLHDTELFEVGEDIPEGSAGFSTSVTKVSSGNKQGRGGAALLGMTQQSGTGVKRSSGSSYLVIVVITAGEGHAVSDVRQGGAGYTVEASLVAAGSKQIRGPPSNISTIVDIQGQGRKQSSGSSFLSLGAGLYGAGKKRAYAGGSVSVMDTLAGEGSKVGEGANYLAAAVTAAGEGAKKEIEAGSAGMKVLVESASAGSKISSGAASIMAETRAAGSGAKRAEEGNTVSTSVQTVGQGNKQSSGSNEVSLFINNNGEGTKTSASGSFLPVVVTMAGEGSKKEAGAGGAGLKITVAHSSEEGNGTKWSSGAASLPIVVSATGHGIKEEIPSGGGGISVTISSASAGTKRNAGNNGLYVTVAMKYVRFVTELAYCNVWYQVRSCKTEVKSTSAVIRFTEKEAKLKVMKKSIKVSTGERKILLKEVR